MAAETWHSRTESSAVGLLDRPEELRITGVVPIVRWARLIKHDPELTDEVTDQAEAAVKAAWPYWKEKYRAFVAQHANISPDSLFFTDKETEIRRKRDGKTPMLDFPRMRALHCPDPFDLRNCCALCTDKYSSKIWTRVGYPFGGMSSELPVGNLRSGVRKFRAMAATYGEWFYAEFLDLMQDVFKPFQITETGTFEITTVGLRVDGECDEHKINHWLFQYDREGVERPNLENDALCELISAAADLDVHPRQLTALEEQAFWMSMPATIELPNGDLASRNVLYAVRPLAADNTVQVVGIGIDDSREGDLAKDVALKVSRFLASRV